MPNIGERFKSQLDNSVERYSKDLAAMCEDFRSQSCGGKARTAYDFTYEVADVFERMEKRIKGEPTSPPSDEWTVAPDAYRNLESATANLKAKADSLGAVLEGMSNEDFDREVAMGDRNWPLFDVASLCIAHTNYHDGQLNIMQCMHGDMAVHWM